MIFLTRQNGQEEHFTMGETPFYNNVAAWAVRSGGDRFVDTEEGIGSNPIPPTISSF